jgi:hypothetical protein
MDPCICGKEVCNELVEILHERDRSPEKLLIFSLIQEGGRLRRLLIIFPDYI